MGVLEEVLGPNWRNDRRVMIGIIFVVFFMPVSP